MRLALILLLCLGGLLRADKPIPPPGLHLFLLAGQSNMAGRDTVEAQDRVTHPRIWMLNANDEWVPAVDPVQFDKPDIVGVGPGRSFALALVEADPDLYIGLVPAAHGGSPLTAWQPGAYFDQTDSHPWDEAVRRTRLALRAGILCGILWHQGEADSHPGLSEVYAEKLHDLITRFRTEFDAPDLPFIAGQMGQWPEAPNNEHRQRVDHVHRSLPEQVPHTAFVSAAGLTPKENDIYHFDAASARKLGRRYAEAYLELSR